MNFTKCRRNALTGARFFFDTKKEKGCRINENDINRNNYFESEFSYRHRITLLTFFCMEQVEVINQRFHMEYRSCLDQDLKTSDVMIQLVHDRTQWMGDTIKSTKTITPRASTPKGHCFFYNKQVDKIPPCSTHRDFLVK